MLSSGRALAAAVAAGFGFAGIWIALAAARPGVTFHLAPIIVAASVAVTRRLASNRPGRSWETAVTPALGAAIGAATLGILSAANLLEGPAFDPFVDVVAESLVGIAIGVIAGLVVEVWPQRTPAEAE